MVFPVEVASNVTVPELWVKVPELVHEPPTVNETEFEACNVVPLPIDTLPFTSKILSLVLLSIVRDVPEFVRERLFETMICPVPVPLKVIVGVPEELVKVRL